MTDFLTAVGGKIAEKWLALLVFPGLLFLAVAVGGGTLGQRDALDAGRLVHLADRLATDPAARAPGTVVLLAALILGAATGAGMLAATLGGGVERLWLGDWPFPLSPAARAITVRRARRWERAGERYRAALLAKIEARGERTVPDTAFDPDPLGPAPPLPDTQALNAARNRVALTRPERPTWMGNRIEAVESRVREHYGLDLVSAWPRLWMLLPDTARADLQAARGALTTATRRTAWGLLYLGIALWWWPAAVAGIGTCTVAWRQGRLAVDTFAELVESTVDLHGRDLATALGFPCRTTTLTRELGIRITRLVRKST